MDLYYIEDINFKGNFKRFYDIFCWGCELFCFYNEFVIIFLLL